VLPWGEDECVLWRVDLPDGAGMELHSAGPRPIAWEAAVDHALCPTVNPRVWVGWYDYPTKTGNFRRLDGKSGAILDEVSVPQWGDLKHGPYGGAVDREGDFWALGWSKGPLVRIDSETLEVERIEIEAPPGGAKFYLYGIAVDRDGNPWLAGEQTVYRYDRGKGTWTHLTIPTGRMRGLQIDRFGRAFIALNNPAGLVVVDTESAAIVAPTVTIPGAMMPVGVSIDVDGAVWVVDRDADRAFKIDPITYAVLMEVAGLSDPYTYSDMTGAGLSLVTYPPEG
jgi:streptogramin lyase